MINEAIDDYELAMICFCLYRSVNLNVFSDNSNPEKRNYIQSMVDYSQVVGKNFASLNVPIESAEKRTGNGLYSMIIDETNDIESIQTRSRWIEPLFSSRNNCSNVHQIEDLEGDDSRDSSYGSLAIHPNQKTKLTMSHMLELCKSTNSRGTCRTCSLDLNKFTASAETMNLKIMDSKNYIEPKCSNKLDSEVEVAAFTLSITSSIRPNKITRHRLTELELGSSALARCFIKTLKQVNADQKLIKVLKSKIKLVDTISSKSRIIVKFNLKGLVLNNGTVKEAVSQGFYPKAKGISLVNIDTVNSTPILNMISKILDITSRTCNPMTFLEPESLLVLDPKELERILNLEFVKKIDRWFPCKIGITENIRTLLCEELRYDKISEIIEGALFSDLHNVEDDKLEIFVDNTRFWM